jgi:large subunit ribosomal protein L18
MLTNIKYKKEAREKRHNSSRKKLSGTAERPRLAVFRSAKHIYAQVINDDQKMTLVSTSDVKLAKGEDAKKGLAKKVGTEIAKLCKEKGIDKVVFDRAGYKYHGRVSALAEGARAAGLSF